MKKISVAHYGLGSNPGGIENYIKDLVDMKPDGYEIHQIVSSASTPCYEDEMVENGIFFHRITPRSKSLLKNIKDLKALIKKERFDVLHFHVNTLSYVSPILIFLQQGVKVVVHAHSTGSNGGLLTNIFHKINKARLRKKNIRRIAVSEEAGVWIFGDKQFDIVRNGINVDKFVFSSEKRKSFRNNLGVCDSTILLGHVGAFVPAKNQVFLVDVLSLLRSKNEKYQLVLIGDGEEVSRVKKYAKEKGVFNYTHFIGKQSDMQKCYSGMDVFLFPSRFEGFGLVLLEAQASGLKCLVSNNIPKDALIDGRSFQLDIENSETWLRNINSLVSSGFCNKERQSELLRKSMADYTLDKNVDSIYKRYFP